MKRVFYNLLISYALGMGLTSCGKQAKPPPEQPRPVYTYTVREPVATITRTFSGLVKSAEGTSLSFEVAGRIIDLSAKAGTRYKEGDALAKIDTTDYENQLESARAQLVEAEQASRRTANLFANGNASKSQLETAISKKDSAQAQFDSATKKVNDGTLRMPYAGVIGKIESEVQQVVNAGQAIMTIQGENGMEFEIGVPVEVVPHLSAGEPPTKARVTLGSLPPDQLFSTTVTEISPQVSKNTTYPVTLRFDKADPALREGMDGEALLQIPNPAGAKISVPLVCVGGQPPNSNYVWIAKFDRDTGTVTKRTVHLGSSRGDGHIEILDGLAVGDVIVSRGVNQLENGTEVLRGKSE
jgi:RND family efflux transporter MFP subunit